MDPSTVVNWLQSNVWAAVWCALLMTLGIAGIDVYFVLYRFYWQMIGHLPADERAALARSLKDVAGDRVADESRDMTTVYLRGRPVLVKMNPDGSVVVTY